MSFDPFSSSSAVESDVSPAGTPPDPSSPIQSSNTNNNHGNVLMSHNLDSPVHNQSSANRSSSQTISEKKISNPIASRPTSHTVSSAQINKSSNPSHVESKTALALWISKQTAQLLADLHEEAAETAFEVRVSDPEKKGEGVLSSHMTYKVNSSLPLAQGRLTQSSVIRRFSDFVWLHDALIANSKIQGILIPPLPDKVLLGRFEGEFVEERRRALELFLFRCLSHPELRKIEELKVFLTGSDAQFQQAKAGKSNNNSLENNVSNSSSSKNNKAEKTGASSFFSYFKEAAASIQNSLSSSSREREKSGDDLACEKVLDYAQQLEGQLLALYSNTEGLIRRDKSLAKAYFELGLAATVLGQSEFSLAGDKLLSSIFTSLGSAADQVHELAKKKTELENHNFRETIKDWTRMTDSLRALLKNRSLALAEHNSALNQLEAKQKGESKSQNLEASIARADDLVRATAQALTTITASTRMEFARFQRDKHRALQKAAEEFVKLQIQHAKQVQEAWEAILPEIQSSQQHPQQQQQ
jgi:sorting nexin-1/2